MGARSSAREAALQMLFAADAAPPLSVERLVASYWRETPGDPEGRLYADEAVRGTLEALDELDGLIRKASAHWRLERMTRVDRNVLRLGAWELTRKRGEVPTPVVLDEAVELAKRYGSDESGAFVNGILDRIAKNAGG